MSLITIDEITFYDEPKKQQRVKDRRATIENTNGDSMYVESGISFSIGTQEEKMSSGYNGPLTIKWAIWLTATMIGSAILIAWAVYALIHSDVNDARASVSSVRDTLSADITTLRTSVSSDVSSLRSDMRADFIRSDEKLDKVIDKIDAMNQSMIKTQAALEAKRD